MKRPQVVEAYMTHSRTPFITEVLKNGKIRKVARCQYFGADSWQREEAERREMYGDRWKGVKHST
jgi:hypothetical protein